MEKIQGSFKNDEGDVIAAGVAEVDLENEKFTLVPREQTAEEAFGELQEPLKADISRFDYEPKTDVAGDEKLIAALELSVNDPEQFKENVRVNSQAAIDACVEATKDAADDADDTEVELPMEHTVVGAVAALDAIDADEPLVGEPELGKLYAYPPEPNIETANKVMKTTVVMQWNPPRLSPVATLDAIDSVVDEAELSDAVCACDTCLESADDTEIEFADADGLKLALDAIADLKLRVAGLEEKVESLETRIVQYNLRSSHKI